MMMMQAGILEAGDPYCSSSALDAMFVTTNFEELDSMSKDELKENDDNALMRFEWLEILVRAAVAKYMFSKKSTGQHRYVAQWTSRGDFQKHPSATCANDLQTYTHTDTHTARLTISFI